jgi:hypothetical protein
MTGKKLIVTAAVVGAALALPSFSSASPEPGWDTVTVTGSTEGGTTAGFTNIGVTAQSDPSGANPSGSVSFNAAGFPVSGSVTCLSVTGPDTGAGTASAPTDAVMNAQTNLGVVTIEVVDNGGNGSDVWSALPTGRAPSDCSPFNLGGTTQLLTEGRAVVFDAPLVPTTKEQCKHGDWKQFGFKNQGQCISFVNHHR